MNEKQINITLNFLKISNLINRKGSEMVSEVGLSSIQQWFILRKLIHSGDTSIGELKKETLVTKQNMTGFINRLEKDGIVRLIPSTIDKRKTLVSITPEGKDTYNRLKESSIKFNQETYSPYTKEEVEELNHLLENLVNHLDIK